MNGQVVPCAPPDGVNPWHSIDWAKVTVYIRRMQARIVKATQEGRWNKVKTLQRLLTCSFYGKALAVRRVTQNRGRNTAGVDEVTWSTPQTKWNAISSLKRHGYKPMPMRRVYIPKSNGKLRPLSIPTMYDRAMQALYLLALDPVAETISDPHSYGFRKARSAADAIGQCFQNSMYWGNPKDVNYVARRNVKTATPRKSAEWILEADIKGCFDNISHAWLLENVPMDKEILRKWLKAGYMEGSTISSTDQGTPQGGIISPVLANLTLNGLESLLDQQFRTIQQRAKAKVYMVRYADDFVITGASRELLEETIRPVVESFLAKRGLELSPEKTKITHITEGYDFLGQNVRRYNKKLLIKPSNKNVKAFLKKVRDMIVQLRPAPQQTVIAILNPIIRGWANYHRAVVAKKTFTYVDHHIWRALWFWAKRRHPNKGKRWVFAKYFHRIGGRGSVFAAPQKDEEGNKKMYTLFSAAAVTIVRHVKIKSNANPYDAEPEMEMYFEKRELKKMIGSLEGRKKLASLWMAQEGKCLHCGEPLTTDDLLDQHHLKERHAGGDDKKENLVLLHTICHKQIHHLGIMLVKPGPGRTGPLSKRDLTKEA